MAKKVSSSMKGDSKHRKVDMMIPVEDYEHPDAHRTNNPPVGLAHLDRDETPVRTLQYDPHLDPQLVWAGKAERETVEVPAPSIHVHEELSAQKIIGSVRRQRLQESLFDIDDLDPDKAVEFYQHKMQWSNRMILGDSLMVMASLLDRERMAGQVQCVFMDPPYGIKYGSNFQPRIDDNSVPDGKDSALTREPEMIQAYRDTWELGVHSYLSYLRDRLEVARNLLTPSGSIFVQISDDNVHLVRAVLDEVFGYDNFVSQIAFTKTTGLGTKKRLASRFDYLIWYARDAEQVRINSLYEEQAPTGDANNWSHLELADGHRRPMTAREKAGIDPVPDGSRIFKPADLSAMGPGSNYEVTFDGRTYRSGTGWWRIPKEGMERLYAQGRLLLTDRTLRYIRYYDDFPYQDLTNLWSGFGGARDKRYVVQTNEAIPARCLLLTTQPGDLVLDPTCGSGTTAKAAELYGRRWVTIDTSRVALAIARERLLTSTYPYFRLTNPEMGVDGGLDVKIAERWRPNAIGRGDGPEQVPILTEPIVESKRARVSGPFTVEALSRYAVNPTDQGVSAPEPTDAADTSDHVSVLLDALKKHGIPRPGGKPYKIVSLTQVASAGGLQAEGVMDADGKQRRFAVALGPKFGAVTMGQVSDAIREAIGFDLVVFAGFAVSADAQEKLATGKVGGVQVALLMANNDLLVGDLLKNTKSSQTFRLYSAPDVSVSRDKDGYRVTVEGVDTFDAATGETISLGKSNIQAWFLDDDYDGTVFRVSQAFFPVSDSWDKLQRVLKGTVDADKLGEMHGWTSLPFSNGENGRIAVRVIAQDGNAAEVVKDDVFSVEAHGTVSLDSVQ